MIDVCICTHNPQKSLFRKILEALGSQTLSKAQYKVWVIDNGSIPSITSDDLLPLHRAGVDYTLLQEPRLGLSYARWCAFEATQAEIVVLVDDDNELADDYLEIVIEIADQNPDIGCFGGKLLLAVEQPYPSWVTPMLPYLGIKDCGNEVISNCADSWGNWEPPGAGAVVRRPILDLYLKRLRSCADAVVLDRSGSNSFLSCGDSMIMRGAYQLGLKCSYQPRLSLNHHINPKRLKFSYLLKLLYGYGRSHVILESSLGHSFSPVGLLNALNTIILNNGHRKSPNLVYTVCMVAWDMGFFREVRRTMTWRQDMVLNLQYMQSNLALLQNVFLRPVWIDPLRNLQSNLNRQSNLAPLQNVLLSLIRVKQLRVLKQQFPENWDRCRKLALRFRLIR